MPIKTLNELSYKAAEKVEEMKAAAQVLEDNVQNNCSTAIFLHSLRIATLLL